MVQSERQRYAAVLAIVAVVVLVVGSRFRPKPGVTNPNIESNVNVTRAELENLQQIVRRNNLRNLSTSFSDVGGNTIGHLVLVQPWAVNGVVLPDIGVVVPKRLDVIPRQLTTVFGSNTHSLMPELWVPGLPFFTSRFSSNASPARLSDSTPDQGGWVVVVANGVFGQTLVSPGIYNGISQEDCGPYIRYRLLTTVPLNKTHIGGGLFDLTGNLQGIVLPCDDDTAIIPVSEVQKAIAAVNTDAGRVLARFGLRLADAAPNTQTSPVVSEVWNDWPVAMADINPGDQLVSINGQNVSSRQDALTALLRTGAHKLELRRGARSFTATISPIPEDSSASLTALAIDDQLGITVARVSRGSSADRAGITPNDRILSVNGRVATEALVERTFARYHVPEPLQLVVQRPGRRLLLTVQP